MPKFLGKKRGCKVFRDSIFPVTPAKHVMVPVTHCPSLKTRIVTVPDGNCFFFNLLYTLTGSQKYHHEVRFTGYDLHMVNNSQLSCFLNVGEIMDSYIEQSQVQSLGTWATEIKI